MNKPYGYIYLTTNKLNGNKYIGKHKAAQFDSQYLGSGIILTNAISKYGFENFTCEVLEWCYSRQQLNDREIYWIGYYDAVEDDKFYNIASGGEGGYLGEKVRLKSKQSKLGHVVSQETRDKISKANKGKIKSLETREKIRQSLLGNHLSIETRTKISNALKGKLAGKANPFTRPEVRAKLKIANAGKNNPAYGKLGIIMVK